MKKGNKILPLKGRKMEEKSTIPTEGDIKEKSNLKELEERCPRTPCRVAMCMWSSLGLIGKPCRYGQRFNGRSSNYITNFILRRYQRNERYFKLLQKERYRCIANKKATLGNDQYKAQNYQEALKLYSDAISLRPDSAAYYGNRSACYMMLLNFPKALADARFAVRIDPKFEKGYVRIAKCCLAMGDPIGAEQAINKILELDSQSTAVKREQQSLVALKRLEANVRSNHAKKNYHNCVYYLDKALNLAPACIGYRLLKSKCLAILGRSAEVLGIAISLFAEDSNSANGFYVHGLYLYYTGHLDDCIGCFERAVQLDPDNIRAIRMGNRSKAISDIKKRGKRLFRARRFREALRVYSDGLKVDKFNKKINLKLLYNRALVNTKISCFHDAISDCSKVLEINSQYLKALLLRARCYNDLEKYDQCVSDYETAFQLTKSPEVKELLLDARNALKRSKRKHYYKILGLSRGANDDELKKAYRKKALIYHPDRHVNSSVDERREAEIKFKEVGQAYAVLSDLNRKIRHYNSQDI